MQQTNRSCPFPHIYMGKETNVKWKFCFVCCKQKMEMANFYLFAVNGNGTRKFVFLGCKRCLLLVLQTRPSMLTSIVQRELKGAKIRYQLKSLHLALNHLYFILKSKRAQSINCKKAVSAA
jgi:hypothetical protein